MPTTAKRKSKRRPRPTPQQTERDLRAKELRAGIRREREVQRLARQLERQIEKSNSVLDELSEAIHRYNSESPTSASASTH